MAERVDGGPKTGPDKDRLVSESLDAIFEPFDDSDSVDEGHNAIVGLLNLVGIYLNSHAPALVKAKAIYCDDFGASEAIMRFQRDVWGVARLRKQITRLRLRKEAEQTLLSQIEKVGIRINSDDPLKTRIAADFTLWMTTFRPISVIADRAPKGFTKDQLVYCNGAFTHWTSCLFLKQYGSVDHGNDEDAGKRLERIRYDFTYRNLTLSSLEMLYCSIFRPR